MDKNNLIAELVLGKGSVKYFSIQKYADHREINADNLPIAIKILLENLLRHCDEAIVTDKLIDQLADWENSQKNKQEIVFYPTRVLMQDFTGVPAIVDLAAMRDAVVKLNGDATRINPLKPVDLVVDHSVAVDRYATDSAFEKNVDIEMQRNHERYQFLRWGQSAFENFRVVPPGTGICHQVNLEYLAKTVWQEKKGDDIFVFPDTLVGTDSHTTMINSLAVLGWGVGGIEAEAAMLGLPITMNIPEVVGFKIDGNLQEGITATDLVLTITELAREHGVVGKFLEFYGSGLDNLTLADRATIANMSPEFGATCSFFAVDQKTLDYLKLTGRSGQQIELVETYSKAQGLWRRNDDAVNYSSTIELQLNDVVPCLSGPKRPQDRVPLKDMAKNFAGISKGKVAKDIEFEESKFDLEDGAVVIAAITSCTNTSNPAVMLAAGLLAKKACELGLKKMPWVKTSLAPGSKVVSDYLNQSGLQKYLDQLGFNLVGYGCTTCIGNSGPLPEEIHQAVNSADLTVCSVLSGNRNFEGRIHALVKANWLASPPLVVAYALAGTVTRNLTTEPLGETEEGKKVYLKDVWPGNEEINEALGSVKKKMFDNNYKDIFSGNKEWNELDVGSGETYQWQEDSTYIRNPPFFDPAIVTDQDNITDARILVLLGNSITTDHISPAGSIGENTPAGVYLKEHGIFPKDFNSYGSRRGNHEVMMRGTFANIRIRNEMLDKIEGGYTRMAGSSEKISIYDAAMKYQENNIPLVVIAGKEYGTGSSRDWAAKGPRLLGVRAVVAESFERIHRSNLAGMGVLPLQFSEEDNRLSLSLSGDEKISIEGLNTLKPGCTVTMKVTRSDGESISVDVVCRLDTDLELDYFLAGGIMPYVVNRFTS